MRKLFKLFLPVLILSIGFASCEKEDEGMSVTSSDIAGTWKLISASGYDKYDGEKENYNYNTEKQILDNMGYLFWYFDMNGKYYQSEKEIYQIPEDSELEDGEFGEGKWEVSDSRFFIDGEKIAITEMTSNKMVWEGSGEIKIDGKKLEYSLKFVFSRVK